MIFFRWLSFWLALMLPLGAALADGMQVPPPSPGQIPGTATNDNASAGNVGEYVLSSIGTSNTATITITIATPAVVTWTGNTYSGYVAIVFSTTGALPTGITAGTTYYTACNGACGDNFNIATSIANAIAGTYVATSGSQSGTQTGAISISAVSTTSYNLCGLSLTAGDWDISGIATLAAASTTVVASTSDLSISATSGTRNTAADAISRIIPYTGVSGNPVTIAAGPYRASIATPTPYYLVLRTTFSTSTLTIQGCAMRARRVR